MIKKVALVLGMLFFGSLFLLVVNSGDKALAQKALSSGEIQLSEDGVFSRGTFQLKITKNGKFAIVRKGRALADGMCRYAAVHPNISRTVDTGNKTVTLLANVPIGDKVMPYKQVIRVVEEGVQFETTFTVPEGLKRGKDFTINTFTHLILERVIEFKGKECKLGNKVGVYPAETKKRTTFLRSREGTLFTAVNEKDYRFKVRFINGGALNVHDDRGWGRETYSVRMNPYLRTAPEKSFLLFTIIPPPEEEFVVKDTKNPNLISNSSFEAGFSKEWKTYAAPYIGDYEDEIKIDNTTAFDGKQSVKVERAQILTKHYFPLKIGKKYTLSAYLKGEKKGQKIYIGITSGHEITLTTDWKRYSTSIFAKAGRPKDGYRVWFDSYHSHESFWVDAVQFEEGEMTDYKHQDDIVFGAWIERYGNVFHPGEPIILNLQAYNMTNQPEQVEVSYCIKDFYGETLREKRQEISIAQGETITEKIEILHQKKGYYVTDISLMGRKTKIKKEESVSFCVITPREADKFYPDSYFGLFLWPSSKTWQLAEKAGAKWTNNYNTQWPQVERTKGNWYWHGDPICNAANKRKVPLFGLFFAPACPKWARQEEVWENSVLTPAKDIADFANYVRQTVGRYKDTIKYWEVSAEAGFLPDEHMKVIIEYHRVAYEIAKEIDPGCKILTCFDNSIKGKENTYRAIKKFLTMGGYKYVDILSIHPYMGKKSPEELELGELLKDLRKFYKERYKKDIEIWATEWGYSGDDYYDPGWDVYGAEIGHVRKRVPEKTQADYILRTHIIMMALGVKKSFYCAWYDGDGQGFSCLRYTAGLSPKPSYVAYATMTEMLEGAEFKQEIEIGESARAYLFQRGKEQIVSFWHLQDSQKAGTISLDFPAKKIKMVRMMGDIEEAKKKGGKLCYSIRSDPHFLIASEIKSKNLVQAFQDAEIRIGDPLRVNITLANINKIAMHLKNVSNKKMSGQAKLILPAGWVGEKTGIPYGPLSPGVSQILEFPLLKCHPEGKVSIKAEITGIKDIVQDINFIPCERIKGKVKIDGRLDEWKGVKPIELKGESYIGEEISAMMKDQENPWKGPEDHSVRIYTTWDKENLYIGVKVTDDDFVHNNLNPVGLWSEDALQIAFDPLNDARSGDKGYGTDDYEYGFALMKTGSTVYRWTAGRNKTKGVIKDVEFVAQRGEAGSVIYEIRIPFEELYPFQPEAGNVMGYNVASIDKHSQSRKILRWMTVTEGILNGKKPWLFSKLVLR